MLIQKRLKGIEPSFKAWEAFVLPLHHSRMQLQKTTSGSVYTARPDSKRSPPVAPGNKWNHPIRDKMG